MNDGLRDDEACPASVSAADRRVDDVLRGFGGGRFEEGKVDWI